MFIADNETAIDLLYYEAIAKTIMRTISTKSSDPLSVGIHGDWGAGKSSVLMMIEEGFEEDDSVLCIRFNGWLFQGFEDAKTVLIESIVDQLVQHRSASESVKHHAKKLWQRINWMKLARKAGSYGVTLATGFPTPETISDMKLVAENVLSGDLSELSPEKLKAVSESADSILNDEVHESAPEHMHAFRQEFSNLLDAAAITKLVVLVDDLDRCLPETAISTLEAIRLFLFVPKASFVIAADEGMIEYCVRQHFPDLPSVAGPATYARNYLEKLIQVPFRLPALGITETRVYVTMLLVLNELGLESNEFQQLIPIAKEVLQRPWAGGNIDRNSLSEKFEIIPEAVEHALDIAFRIAPVLTDGTKGNPRQIKRFINTMALRQAIAEERGFGAEIKPNVLAKIMLAERFAPEVFDAFARSSAATGYSEEISRLEADSGIVEIESTNKKDLPKETSFLAPDLPDWPNIEWAKNWASIQPSIGNIDLRPYLFVSRDHRGAYGYSSTSSEADELLEALMGPPVQIIKISSQLSRLTKADAENIFDVLKTKIVDAENLIDEPPGVHGLNAVCRHHSFLQASLVAFFKSLPVQNLGTWIAVGWESALTQSDAKSEYEKLKSDWANQDENISLRETIRASKKVKRNKKGEK